MAMQTRIDITANTEGFKKGMDEVKASTSKTSSEFNNNQKSVKSLSQQYRVAKKALETTTLAYRQMSAEMKKSSVGQAQLKEIEELKKRAAELYDIRADVQRQVKNMASDTANWDAAKEGINAINSSVQVFAASMGVAADDGTLLGKSLNLMAKSQTIANAAVNIGNALQQESELRIKATELAQKALNSIMMKNPYALAAMVLATLVAGFVTYKYALKDTTEEEKRAAREAEELKKKQENLRKQTNELNAAAATTTTKYFELQTQWKSLKTEAEKKQWIEDNQSAFDSLGISINSVSDAENALVKNTNAVVTALLKRAVAAKAAELKSQEYYDLEMKKREHSVESGDYYYKANSQTELSDEDAKAAGVRTTAERLQKNSKYNQYGGSTNIDNWTPEELEKIDKYNEKKAIERKKKRKKEIEDEQEAVVKGYTEEVQTIAEQEKKLNNLGVGTGKHHTGGGHTGDGHTGGGHSNTNKDKKEILDDTKQLEKFEKELSDFKNKHKDGILSDEDSKKLQDLQEQVEGKKLEMGMEFDMSKISLPELETKLSNFKKKYEDGLLPDVKPEQYTNIIETVENEISNRRIELGIEAPKDSLSSLEKQLSELKNKYRDGLLPRMSKDEYLSEVEKLEKQIENKEIEIGIKLPKSDIDQIVSNAQQDFKLAIDTADTESKLKNLVSILETLKENTEIGSTEWETYNTLIENANKKMEPTISTSEKVGGAMRNVSAAVGSLGNAFNGLADSFELPALDIAGTIAQAIANIVLAFGDALSKDKSSKSSIFSFIGASISAVATMAALISQVKSASSFANGGIIQGSTTIGDYNIARVNDGEMILNGRQQKNLFDILDNGITKPNNIDELKNVVFKLKGTELIGLINNTNKIYNRR